MSRGPTLHDVRPQRPSGSPAMMDKRPGVAISPPSTADADNNEADPAKPAAAAATLYTMDGGDPAAEQQQQQQRSYTTALAWHDDGRDHHRRSTPPTTSWTAKANSSSSSAAREPASASTDSASTFLASSSSSSSASFPPPPPSLSSSSSPPPPPGSVSGLKRKRSSGSPAPHATRFGAGAAAGDQLADGMTQQPEGSSSLGTPFGAPPSPPSRAHTTTVVTTTTGSPAAKRQHRERGRSGTPPRSRDGAAIDLDGSARHAEPLPSAADGVAASAPTSSGPQHESSPPSPSPGAVTPAAAAASAPIRPPLPSLLPLASPSLPSSESAAGWKFQPVGSCSASNPAAPAASTRSASPPLPSPPAAAAAAPRPPPPSAPSSRSPPPHPHPDFATASAAPKIAPAPLAAPITTATTTATTTTASSSSTGATHHIHPDAAPSQSATASTPSSTQPPASTASPSVHLDAASSAALTDHHVGAASAAACQKSAGNGDTSVGLTTPATDATPSAPTMTAPVSDDEDAEGEDDPRAFESLPAPALTTVSVKPDEGPQPVVGSEQVKVEAEPDDHGSLLTSRSPANRLRKLAAVRAPSVTGERLTKSLVASPVPAAAATALVSDASAAASLPSTRATTPALNATPRSRRRKKERAAAGGAGARPPLPRLDSADRRRSGRIAKATTSGSATSESSAFPQLAKFGFSPYLEGLVMGARETDRKTRSGGRGARAAIISRSLQPPKRNSRAKARDKDKDQAADLDREPGDGPSDDVKAELYLQLCILSYQLQAELDMVPFKTVEQLKAEFLAPPAEAAADGQGALDAGLHEHPISIGPDGWPPTPPPQHTPIDTAAPSTAKTSARTSRHPSPSKVAQSAVVPPSTRGPTASPPSSPEMPLMASLASYRQSQEDSGRPAPRFPTRSPTPEFRPSRPNIMSISSLMCEPAPRLPTPPPPPTTVAQGWTYEDELATEILQGLGLDPRGFVPVEAAPPVSGSVTRSGTQTPCDTQPGTAPLPVSDFDPHRMDILSRLDLGDLFEQEEGEYAKEREACSELYASLRYLAVYDEVVDRWRAAELSRLRKQIGMRKEEVGRLLSAERDAAWMDFHEQQESVLVRQAAEKLNHQRWQAESELHRLTVCKPKSRSMKVVERDLFVPDDSDAGNLAEGRRLYHQYGSFLHGSRRFADQGPLVRADVDKIRRGVAAAHTGEADADSGETETDAGIVQHVDGDDGVVLIGQTDDVDMDVDEEEDGDEEEEDDGEESDSSYDSASADEGISSLPSFTTSVESDSSDSGSVFGASSAEEHQWRQDLLEDESSDDDIALITLQRAAAQIESETGSQPLKRKRRSPPPGVRWWKAGRPMAS